MESLQESPSQQEGNSCCPPGSWGAPVSAPDYLEITGDMTEIGEHKLPVYYASPKQPSTKGIVMLPDIFGATNLLKGFCDVFASHGFHCLLADSFRGDICDRMTFEDMGSRFDWIRKFPYDPVVKCDIEVCFQFLAEKGVDRSQIGALGFCWGCWAFIKASSDGAQFRCGVGPHPSTRIERLGFKSDERAMFEKVNMPVLLMPCGNDMDNIKPGGECMTILESKGGKCIFFENMKHGFVCRGDMSDPEVKKETEACLQHALEYFDEHLK